MKLIRNAGNRLLIHIGLREKDLLTSVLRLYPCVPPAHQQLSKSGGLKDSAGSQQLLDEALAEHRAEKKKQVENLLENSQRFAKVDSGWRFTLSPGELEMLLQVLNDIRVGSWLRLGSPEGRVQKLDDETAPHLWAMEMSGLFQMWFLEVMNGGA